MMYRRCLLVLLSFAAFVPAARAVTADHLQCFKIKDHTDKATYTATIDPTDATFPVAPGCTVKVPAKLLCIDAVKSNVVPSPPGSPPGTAAQRYLCYKTKCAKAESSARLTDQFGTHDVDVKGTSLLCAPVEPPCLPPGAVTTGTFPFGNGQDSNTCLAALRARCCSGLAAAGSSCSCIPGPNCIGQVTCQ